ncbi:MAG TPA: dienelactone hydrolase family protein [Candidatus Obscuribacterales bacterium]
MEQAATPVKDRGVMIPVGSVELAGDLSIPAAARGIVLFAHGSGSSRHSPRNRFVAGRLQDAGLGTLLMDLLTAGEEEIDMQTRHLRFDIELLAERLVAATDWLKENSDTNRLSIGYFGASTGAAAALVAASARADEIFAVVSRGGRPDLAESALPLVKAPTLLIVGGYDTQVISLNESAMQQMTAHKELTIVPRATHLFEEPGALEKVADLACDWFLKHLTGR